MALASTRTASPSDAYLAWTSANRAVIAACPLDLAAAALNDVLQRRGSGSVEELRIVLGVSRQTVRNWRLRRVEFTPADIWRVATYYAAENPPSTVTELDALVDTGTDGAAELFDLFYSDDPCDATCWLLDHRAGNFRWNTEAA